MVEPIQAGKGVVLIRVYVSPRSSANRIVGEHNGALKVALTAPPVDGAANKALIDFLAKALSVPKADVTIQSGEASRNKTIAVSSLDVVEAARRLGII